MDFREERQLAKGFFMEMSSRQLAHVPNDYWRFTAPQDHTWCFEVLPDQLEKHPYRFSLHFDQRNRVLTFSLLHQHAKTVRIFAHLYHGLIDFLTTHEVDCVVRNEDDCLTGSLYKKRKVSFHSTGIMSKQIEELLENILTYVYQGKIFFWKEGHTLHLATPLISPIFWDISFIYDESRKKIQGRVEVAGVEVANRQDIQLIFGEIQEKMQQVLLLEQSIIGMVNRLASNSYYDPHSRSLMIFGKEVPFKVCLVRSRETQSAYQYAVRFGQKQVESTEQEELLGNVGKLCEQYIKSERLRAALEGRA